LELAWAGEADVYDIPPPDFSAMTEFETVERSLSATRTGDTNRLKYEFTMKPLKQGECNLDKMNVQYFEKGADVPIRLELPRAVVRVVSPQLVPRVAKVGIGIAALVAAGAAAIVLATRSKKRSRQERSKRSKTAADARSSIVAELDAARRHRIEGEFGTYLEALCAMADSEALRAHIARGAELHELAENVKFGGNIPSPDQLAWAEKLIKSAIERSFPARDAGEEL
jgi:hypothetical protein